MSRIRTQCNGNIKYSHLAVVEHAEYHGARGVWFRNYRNGSARVILVGVVALIVRRAALGARAGARARFVEGLAPHDRGRRTVDRDGRDAWERWRAVGSAPVDRRAGGG